MPLMTGMVHTSASSTMVLCSMTRAMTTSTRRESTLPVSPMVSWPPSWLMTVSNDTRVRVLDC